ncbi:WD repeat-containing protein isoform 1 [Schistosoma japonicum]|uniref:Dynein axonemal intermediate chain 4 n=1 Tax=Schistosoma japonicum TaxID=6182 RepID=A0A4Z2DPQ5_SCHJA|nr:WD repeat-containing protein isoform 1 [Schistosoma japonicum]
MSGGHKKGQTVRKTALILGRRVSSSFSKKSAPEKRLSRTTVRLIDESGIDLTPLPLLSDEKRIREEKETMSADISQSSIHGGSSLHITNPFTFTRSYISGSSPTGESHSETSDEPDHYRTFTEIKTLIQPKEEILTEIDLNKLIDIIIMETETFWIFDQPPKFISEDSNDVEEQLKRNETYKTLLTSKVGNDRYIEHGMNTFNLPSITKSIQTDEIGLHEIATMVTNWDMVDTYEKEREEETRRKLLEDNDEVNSHRKKIKTDLNKMNHDNQIKTTQNVGEIQLQPDDGGPLESTQPLRDSLTGGGTGTSQTYSSTQCTTSDITNTESDLMSTHGNSMGQLTNTLELLETLKMKKDLSSMERALNLNTYHDKLIKYYSLHLHKCYSNMDSSSAMKLNSRMSKTSVNDASNVNSIEYESSTPKTSLSTLHPPSSTTTIRNLGSVNSNSSTSYRDNSLLGISELTKRQTTTPQNPHVIPLWRFQCSSTKVGMFNGVVFVYDVRKNDPLPVIDTTYASGRHLGPVRKLQWIVQELGSTENLSEVLISVSNDGRITQWFIRKGFESTDLMVLKRTYSTILSPMMNTSKRNESLISRTAFATSMAFNKRELSIYVVGTEDGPIYKCSCSYNEQYLDTYFGHTASVYQIEWSPFVPEVFLSCSADMTIKLWHSDHQQPLITIRRNLTPIPSISWSPHNSCIFAAINEGVLEIWNLDYSTVDPYISETISNEANMTSVLFSETSQSVLVGDDQGTVHVYTLADFPYSSESLESDQVRKCFEVCTCCNS